MIKITKCEPQQSFVWVARYDVQSLGVFVGQACISKLGPIVLDVVHGIELTSKEAATIKAMVAQSEE
jgi:hypothetical protein